MTRGRTTWFARDAAFHRRELIVELGAEHGAPALAVLDVLSAWAQEQREGGQVKGGYLTLAREAFTAIDAARAVVEHAARIGVLDDFELLPDGRRFTCRVSGWRDEQDRARAANRQSNARDTAVTDRDIPSPAVTDRDEARQGVTDRDGPSPTRPDQTKKLASLASGERANRSKKPVGPSDADEPPPDFPDELRAALPGVVAVLQRIAAARDANAVTTAATARAMQSYPRRPHIRAAEDLEHWLVHGTGQRTAVKDVVAFFRNQLDRRWQDVAAPIPGTAGRGGAADGMAKLRALAARQQTQQPDGAA